MVSIKIQRLQKQIHQKIATILTRDLADPRISLVTITRVELAKDLSVAKIWWSTLLEGSERRTVERGLEDARGFIQREVARILKTRLAPQLQWEFDRSIEGVDRVARLLREVRAEDEERARARGDGGEMSDQEPLPPPEDEPLDGPAGVPN